MIRFGENHMEWNLDQMLHALGKELDVLEGYVPLLNCNQNGLRRPEYTRPNKPQQDRPTTASALIAAKGGQPKCTFCLGSHPSESCETVKDPESRRKVLIKYAKCFSCFKPGHRYFKCSAKVKCDHCKGNHHQLICNSTTADAAPKETRPQATAPAMDPNAAAWVGVGNTSSGGQVALQTALAVVNGNREKIVRVLFDTGSHKTFITSEAVGKLGLEPVRSERLGIKAFGSKEPDVACRDVVNLSLGGVRGKKNVSIEAYVVDDISSIQNIHVEHVKKNYEYLSHVYFSDVCRDKETLLIDCLVGSDFFWAFQEDHSIRGGPNEPVAVKTTLGWVLSGPLKGKNSVSSFDNNVDLIINAMRVSSEVKPDVDFNVHKLWDLDSIGIRERDPVHELTLDNISFTGKRYSVGLPWKAGQNNLPSNYNISLLRLNNQVRKLKQTPDVLQKYEDVIQQQVHDGIIEQVSELEPAGKVHYLPHRAVVREDAETTRVRIVYDASCKDRKIGVSLNDCLHVGPALTPLIFDVLLRFRCHPVALVGDIEKAFLNIDIHPQDRDCLRFLWYKDVNAAEPEVRVYRFNWVVFGCNSSPFLLNCVLRHHINKYVEKDPEFVGKLIGGFFVDDLVVSCKDPQEALSLHVKAKERMKEGGFTLRKWKTSDKKLAEEIWQREGEVKQKLEDQSYTKETLGAQVNEKGKTKVLGLAWDNEKDEIEFDLAKIGKMNETKPTKRGILSILASVFDPLGLISPIAVSAKILFQELCVETLGWDDPLPEEKSVRWEAWLRDLLDTRSVTVSRCMLDNVKGDILKREIHGFADASKKAYCAMVYLVCYSTKGIYTKLLAAKTRVAPLKTLSIPRLELMSARVLANLVKTVTDALSQEIKVDCVRYWLDSKTALYWIYNNGEWKQFVQHRVNEILQKSKKEEWGHVSGVHNPADLGSRGATASYLKTSESWWEGPKWLRMGEEHWPTMFSPEDSGEVGSERRKMNVMLAVEVEQTGIGNVINIERYGSLRKLLNVTAYVQRFVRNLKSKKAGNEVCKDGMLSVEEIEAAESIWIREVQNQLKRESGYKNMSIQLGIESENGVLVCKGRLGESDLDFRSKYPIILPKANPFTDLVIRECHHKVHHNKLRSTLAELRSRFWVPQGRQQVKKVIGKCHTCKRLEGKLFQSPPVAELPGFRVNEDRPFANTGIDFAGPLYVKGEKGEIKKVYIALFTCCVTRAVHLELVNDLNAITFSNCFRRFCSRRGTPRLVNTDNAKTFKAAANLMKKLFKDNDFNSFQQANRIKWRFNLPRSPWWGGYFERMVGSVKRCLRKVLGNARLTSDELTTVLVEVEGTLNSRPLTYLYDELGEVLTPSHLIHGFRLSSLPGDIDLTDYSDNTQDKLTKRFVYVSKKLSHFWNRWRKEYLTDLREFHKMTTINIKPIAKGDLVLLHEDNVKRSLWKTGLVEDLIIGKDGKCRGAVVRKVSSRGKLETLTRPLQKLVPLEISSHECEKTVGKQKERVENESADRSRPTRAAARDARWKSRLCLLDP
eukprot:gene17243-biopygen14837